VRQARCVDGAHTSEIRAERARDALLAGRGRVGDARTQGPPGFLIDAERRCAFGEELEKVVGDLI
jgi:hypothetical protein